MAEFVLATAKLSSAEVKYLESLKIVVHIVRREMPKCALLCLYMIYEMYVRYLTQICLQLLVEKFI